MTTPRVSVVIPLYNRANLVGRAVACALAQEPAVTEVIVVDDASTDAPEAALEAIEDSRLRMIRHPENRGAAAARNTGVKAAAGEVIAFLDSDDLWLPGKLAAQLDVLDTDGDSALIACSGYSITRPHRREPQRVVPDSKIGPNRMIWGCDLSPGSTMLVRREAFEQIGLFDERLRRFEDWLWLLRYGMEHRLAMAKEPLVEVNVLGWPSYELVCESCAQMLAAIASDGPRLSRPQFRKLLAAMEIEKAAAAHRHGRTRAVIQHATRSLAFWPLRNVSFWLRALRFFTLFR